MVDLSFWRRARTQEQQGHGGPYTDLSQLPKGAVVHRPEGQMQQQIKGPILEPEHAARLAMATSEVS